MLDIPPETSSLSQMDGDKARALFAEIGAADASTHSGESTRHPHMHRTQTIDYGIVLDGEITLLVDEGEVTVRAGDIVVQRGTNHAWGESIGPIVPDCFHTDRRPIYKRPVLIGEFYRPESSVTDVRIVSLARAGGERSWRVPR